MFGWVPLGFRIVFAVVWAIILLGFVAMVVIAVKRAKIARQVGLNPLGGDIQVLGAVKDAATSIASSQGQVADHTVTARLKEADALFASGAISQSEHQAMRQRILGSL